MVLNPHQFGGDEPLPGMPGPAQGPRRNPAAATPRKPGWSGIAPGQMVMGVKDLGSLHLPADPHGFIHEETTPLSFLSKDPHQFDQEGNKVSAKDYYETHGGAKHKDPKVQAHWARYPVQNVRADAIIHTAQHWRTETESGTNAMIQEGRQRINSIRKDLEGGNSIQNPVWLMKHNDRLFSLDGHHRMVAAREAGLANFPARIWDRDAEMRPTSS